MGREPVMHLIDTLDAGGAERMCVQLANALAEEGWDVHLCATRRGGPLEQGIGERVRLLKLGRRSRFDAGAVLRLRRYIREHGIRLLHAHGTAVFVAAAVSAGLSNVRLIWHAHYGGLVRKRAAWLYRVVRGRIAAVLAVNEELARWSRERLGFGQDRVLVVPNFAMPIESAEAPELPGVAGFRLVQLANVRPQKDHPMMLRAMARIVREEPRAHLLIVGRCDGDGYGGQVRQMVKELGLENAVTFLGVRQDVGAILKACDLGVLSSRSEGLPVALLEYGEAGLAVVCTDVGDCQKVVEGCGVVVPAGDDEQMAREVLTLLGAPERREAMARLLRSTVEAFWSKKRAVRTVMEVYEAALR